MELEQRKHVRGASLAAVPVSSLLADVEKNASQGVLGDQPFVPKKKELSAFEPEIHQTPEIES